ncbi:MAG: adenosine kinase, partial [Proteobacteria bacterium]|nr:adenosine kinase [Pseudomonadota bacterium]
KTDLNQRPVSLSCCCSLLYDRIIKVSDNTLQQLNLEKSITVIGSKQEQQALLERLIAWQSPSQGTSHSGKGLFSFAVGGSCANVARTMAAMAEKTCFASAIAADQEGLDLKNMLAELDDFHGYLTTTPGHTGSTLVLVTPDGERTMHAQLGVCSAINQKVFQQMTPDLGESAIFHFCGYQWDAASQQQMIQFALVKSQESGLLISFDLADPGVVQRHHHDFLELLHEVHLVFANELEILELFGDDFERILHQNWSHKLFVIKRGAKDLILCYRGDTLLVPAKKDVAIIDTTGAGDVLAGGFLAGLMKGLDIQKSTEVGVCLASDVITRLGCVLSEQAIKQAYEMTVKMTS